MASLTFCIDQKGKTHVVLQVFNTTKFLLVILPQKNKYQKYKLKLFFYIALDIL